MTDQPSSEEEFALRADRLLDGLRKDAERRGWTFHAEPPREAVPDFVKGYEPDAIVVTPEGGVIIEITDRKDLAQRGRLADIAKTIAEQPGWSFRVFYANPSDRAVSSVVSPTSEELASGIREARALDEMGHERAALVMGWATLEAIARMIMSRSGADPAGSLSPVQAVQVLVQEGYLDDEDGRRLRSLARLRNEVVHGGLSTTIPREDVARLIEDLEAITGHLRQAA